MNGMELFCMISGSCSILSLIVSLLVLTYSISIKKSIKQKIKGDNNVTAGRDVEY